MPAMQTVYDRLKEQGFEVVAINELEDVQKVRDHIQEHQHTFEVLLDPDNHVANMYGVVGLYCRNRSTHASGIKTLLPFV
jgi:peroxiredoxin